MKTVLRILGWLFGGIAVLIAGASVYVFTNFPKAGPTPDITVEQTPERIERGRYLAEHVSMCTTCHAPQDHNAYGTKAIAGKAGTGGKFVDESDGFPGTLYAPNITPAGLAEWTDGEIFRAITEGVSRDGRALFPIMPYEDFRYLTREDAYAIIAYLRSMPALPAESPQITELGFPVNIIARFMPSPYEEPAPVDTSNKIAYGKYMATVGLCANCHVTRDANHAPIEGMEFAGGTPFPLKSGAVSRPANLTPHKETGIGFWNEALFLQRFSAFHPETYKAEDVPFGQFNTAMPWQSLAGMKQSDLSAIYAYLQTVKPVKNAVEKFTPPAGGGASAASGSGN